MKENINDDLEELDMKKVPIRYRSENDVKKALKIDTFRNLSKDKVMKFVSMIPYMDKEVALAVINQFPKFADFAKLAIEHYTELCNVVLAKNNESQSAVIKGYQTILDALSQQMNKENISEEERKTITDNMIYVADKIAEADLKNKKFLNGLMSKVTLGIGVGIAIVGAAIGISSSMNSTGGHHNLMIEKIKNKYLYN